MRPWYRCIWSGTVVAVTCGPAGADVLLDQRHDYVNGLGSIVDEEIGLLARTADDFTVARDFTMQSLTYWMLVTFPNVPGDFGFELYEQVIDSGDFEPAQDPFLQLIGPSTIIDHGWHPTFPTHRYYELTYDALDIELPGGTYWLSAFGMGNGNFSDLSWWGTSGDGEINGSEGYHKGGMNQVWLPARFYLGFPSDFAMRIEGTLVPAPSAISALAILALGRASRRRRMRN